MDALGLERPPTRRTPPPTSTDMIAWCRARGAGLAYETSDGVYSTRRRSRVRAAGPAVARADAGRRPGRDHDEKRTRSTSRCGSWPSRASRRGRRRSATGGRAGTPSAWSCRSTCWARASTCTPAARTCASPPRERAGPGRGAGPRFANHWMHHAFVEVKGEKMSKSLGNVTNLVDLLAEYEPAGVRLLILRSHYRSPMDVTARRMADTEDRAGRLDTFARRAAAHRGRGRDPTRPSSVPAAMDDDLDTPRPRPAVRAGPPGQHGPRRGLTGPTAARAWRPRSREPERGAGQVLVASGGRGAGRDRRPWPADRTPPPPPPTQGPGRQGLGLRADAQPRKPHRGRRLRGRGRRQQAPRVRPGAERWLGGGSAPGPTRGRRSSSASDVERPAGQPATAPPNSGKTKNAH
jgi:hypothetical protein